MICNPTDDSKGHIDWKADRDQIWSVSWNQVKQKRDLCKKKKSHSSENMDKKKGKPEQIDKDCGWNYLAKS